MATAQQPNSPTAQQPNSPNAQMLLMLVSICWFVTLLSSGCNTSTIGASGGSVNNTSVAPDRSRVIDAGVVFANESNCRCLPFEQIGLDPNARIISIRISCECVTGSEVAYKGIDGKSRKGIRLDWSKEAIESATTYRPASLGVIVEIEFATTPETSQSQTLSLTVSFLHTVAEGS